MAILDLHDSVKRRLEEQAPKAGFNKWTDLARHILIRWLDAEE